MAYKLVAKTRTLKGNQARKLRREGVLPAVAYGVGENMDIEINFNEFIKIFNQSGKTNVIDLEIDGKAVPTLVQDIDVDPVRTIPRHVDFLVVDLTKTVTANPKIVLVGESPAISASKGMLNNIINNIEISASPANIPSVIEVDISTLVEIGDSVKVSDLVSGDKYEITEDQESTIVSVVEFTKEEEVVAAPAEGEQTAEGGDESVEESDSEKASE